MAIREFAATRQASNLETNIQRLKNNTSKSTLLQYQKRWQGFTEKTHASQLEQSISSTINTTIQKAKSKKLSWNTVRLYKAVISYGLTMTYFARYQPNNTDFLTVSEASGYLAPQGLIFNNIITKDFLNSKYLEIKDFNLPKDEKIFAGKSGQTSANKLKNLPENILDFIINEPSYSDIKYETLRLFLKCNSILGLRPIEWFEMQAMPLSEFESRMGEWFNNYSDAEIVECNRRRNMIACPSTFYDAIENNKKRSVFVVKNAKNTHGRVGIDYRVLHTADEALYVDVQNTQNKLIELTAKIIGGKNSGEQNETFWKEVFSDALASLQKQFAWIVRNDKAILSILKKQHMNRIRVNVNRAAISKQEAEQLKTQIKYPTLYSTRHQAVANAKNSGFHPVEIAALFGHASPVTADRHYGKKIHGKNGSLVNPDNKNIQSVILGLKEKQILNLASDYDVQLNPQDLQMSFDAGVRV